jgi:hypothetical protein
MNWNSAMDMPRFWIWYSGIWRYFSSSASQPSSVSGGIAPVTGRHSVIERPGIGQARRPAHQDHRAHKGRHDHQPPEHGAVGVRRGERLGDGGDGEHRRSGRTIPVLGVAQVIIHPAPRCKPRAPFRRAIRTDHSASVQDWPDRPCMRLLTLYVNVREDFAMSLETFRKETRAWLEENCPASMRKPIKSEADICWGGKQLDLRQRGPEGLAGAHGEPGLDGADLADRIRRRRAVQGRSFHPERRE